MKFIGAIKPQIGGYKFLNPVFESSLSGEYFIAEKEGDVIVSFELISYKFDLICSQKNIETDVGGQFIYCYLLKDSSIIYGTREQIQNVLIKFLHLKDINVFAKLVLARFLGIYAMSLSLINDANTEFKKYGIKKNINDSVVFNESQKFTSQNYEGILKKIHKKIESFDEMQFETKSDDFFFFNEDKVYFDNIEFTFAEFITNTKGSRFRDEIEKSIIECSFNDRINLKKLSSQDNVFQYFLLSDKIVLNQKNIEKHLSSIVEQKSDDNCISIVDAGIIVDKEIYSKKKRKKNYTKEQFKLLDASVSEIIKGDLLNNIDNGK